MKKRRAGAVDAIVLVRKIKDPMPETPIAMFGFETEDVWLTGKGMDDPNIKDEANRHMGGIAIANS